MQINIASSKVKQKRTFNNKKTEVKSVGLRIYFIICSDIVQSLQIYAVCVSCGVHI